MMRSARALGRIAASVLHGFHGLWLVLFRFPSYDIAKRRACVGWWSRKMLHRMGVELRTGGQAAEGSVLLVANHVSWLDILAIHAVVPRARFVSKADVKTWPLIGRLADAADTLYIERDRKRDARRVVHAIAKSLEAGDMVVVFPEGTVGDGHELLPFHANLLQSAIETGTPIQPVAIRYSDAHAAVSAAVFFVGPITLGQSLWGVACADELVVHVEVLPVRASADADRRTLAQALRDEVAAAVSR